MALFESKDTRVARKRVAIQMGRNSVKEYVDNCKSVQCSDYGWTIAW